MDEIQQLQQANVKNKASVTNAMLLIETLTPQIQAREKTITERQQQMDEIQEQIQQITTIRADRLALLDAAYEWALSASGDPPPQHIDKHPDIYELATQLYTAAESHVQTEKALTTARGVADIKAARIHRDNASKKRDDAMIAMIELREQTEVNKA